MRQYVADIFADDFATGGLGMVDRGLIGVKVVIISIPYDNVVLRGFEDSLELFLLLLLFSQISNGADSDELVVEGGFFCPNFYWENCAILF